MQLLDNSLDVEGGGRADRDVVAKCCEEIAVKPTTYVGLMVENPNYRWFLASYVVTHCGE
jgi:hypothetical protein